MRVLKREKEKRNSCSSSTGSRGKEKKKRIMRQTKFGKKCVCVERGVSPREVYTVYKMQTETVHTQREDLFFLARK